MRRILSKREGKVKKKILNGQRCSAGQYPGLPQVSTHGEKIAGVCETPPHHTLHHTIDETAVNYLQTVTSLIEGRTVCMDEIKRMLNKILRQLSIGRQKKSVYADNYPRGKPT